MANKVTTKAKLSGSVGWKNILITTTSGTGDLIHTGDLVKMHEVRLWATNTGALSVDVTIQRWGTTTQDEITVTLLPKQWLTMVVPGWILEWNGTPYVVRADASIANVVTVWGYVHILDNY